MLSTLCQVSAQADRISEQLAIANDESTIDKHAEVSYLLIRICRFGARAHTHTAHPPRLCTHALSSILARARTRVAGLRSSASGAGALRGRRLWRRRRRLVPRWRCAAPHPRPTGPIIQITD